MHQAHLWEKIAETPVTTASPYRKLLTKSFRLSDGSETRYDIKEEGRAVCLLALTPEHSVIMVRQYRPGPELLMLEMPGGGVEPGETPEDAAARELLEETGYEGELHLVGTSLDCAYSTLVRTTFVVKNCRQVAVPAGEGDESGDVVLLSLAEFRAHLRTGQLTDVECGYLALDFLSLL